MQHFSQIVPRVCTLVHFIFLVMQPAICIIIRRFLDNGRKKVNQLRKVISNRNINLSAQRLLLLSVIRPRIEYGSEVWEVIRVRQVLWKP